MMTMRMRMIKDEDDKGRRCQRMRMMKDDDKG